MTRSGAFVPYQRCRRGWIPWTFAIVVLLVLSPRLAWAHAHLRKSNPAAGTVSAAPRAIRLWFTEEPELSLTLVRLTDSTGTAVILGTPTHDVDGALSVRLAVASALHAGSWTVTWRTAALDGHPSNGAFTFRVVANAATGPVPAALPPGKGTLAPVPVAPATMSPTAPSADPSALTPPYVVVRALSFVALLALIGAAVFRYAVMPRVASELGTEADVIVQRLASGAALAAVCYLIAAALRLSLQNQMMTGDAMADTAHMRTMAMETHWGAIWRLQFSAGVAALLGALIARRGSAIGWLLLGLSGLALAGGAALGGHAAAAESLRTVAVFDDALHVVAAAGWLGSLLWLTVGALPWLAKGADARAGRIAALVRAFSPTALVCAGLVVVTGLVSAWLRLGSVPMLWRSSYGQALVVKLLLLGGVAGTGFYNWRYVQPALGTDAASARLSRSARVELAIGLLVLVATAVLVAMPTPMLSP